MQRLLGRLRKSGRGAHQDYERKTLWAEEWCNLDYWYIVDAGGGFGNQELQYYVPANARAHDGQLIISASAAKDQYRSAKLICRRPLGVESGYLEFETISVPQTAGLWPAIWLLPLNGTEELVDGKVWPDGGEIDVIECSGDKPDTIHAAHWGYHNAEDAGKHFVHTSMLPDLPSRKHKIGLAFSDFKLRWYVDDKAVASVTVPSPPFSSMSVFTPIINLAMGGSLTQHTAPKDGQYEMRIGRIALYSQPPGGWEHSKHAQNQR